jgi:hypothetical protein
VCCGFSLAAKTASEKLRRGRIVSQPEQLQSPSVLQFRRARCGHRENIQGKQPMKTTTILAIAFGIGALAACNKSPTEQAAENVESNYGNAAENVEATTSNLSDAIQANGENAASEVKDAGKNTASEIKNEGKEKANAIRNGAATNNSQ